MLITDKNELKKYTTSYRLWQGVPGFEITKKGRMFSCFYSGGIKEQVDNFVVLLKSDDGVYFGEPIAVAFKKNYRCFDACLWIDPLGRLWFTWSFAPEHAVWAVICDDPDADEIIWGKEFKIGKDVMMNKPIVLSTGEWLFPIAVWNNGIYTGGSEFETKDTERGSFVYKTVDNGRTFEKIGKADVVPRTYDEHMLLEHKDGRIAMYVRTEYGIGVAYSYDRGKTWTKGEDSGLGGPCSRFCIKRLKSGRILLVNHYEFTGRNNLTAMLSEDEGKTWKYKLLLDGRRGVSYPDAVETDDGYIYICYDHERGSSNSTIEQIYAQAREILYTRITEQDIINGEFSDESKKAVIISKLGEYAKDAKNPFAEVKKYYIEELVKYLKSKTPGEIIDELFETYNINCMNMHKLDNERLDLLLDELNKNPLNREKTITEIAKLVCSVDEASKKEIPVVSLVKDLVKERFTHDILLKSLAEELGISIFYMCHLFKKETGLTIIDYKNQLRITRAKYLLINTNMKITEITQECGFGSDSYFSKVFIDSEKVSPTQYRNLLKK